MASIPGLGDSVKPLKNASPVKHEWSGYGLPESGWILVHDRDVCDCDTKPFKPCAVACAQEHELDVEQRLALGACAQCDPAACEAACPVTAFVRTAQGSLEVDQELCIGCRFCQDACPNHALMLVSPYEVEPPAVTAADYNSGRPAGSIPNTVTKCTMCSYRIMEGQLPICVEGCPDGAIWICNLDRNTAANRFKVVRLTDLLAGRTLDPIPGGNRELNIHG